MGKKVKRSENTDIFTEFFFIFIFNEENQNYYGNGKVFFLVLCYLIFFVSDVFYSLVSCVLINNVGILGDRRASKRGVSVRANSVHEPTVKNRTSHTHTHTFKSMRLFCCVLYFIIVRARREDTLYLEHEDHRQKRIIIITKKNPICYIQPWTYNNVPYRGNWTIFDLWDVF